MSFEIWMKKISMLKDKLKHIGRKLEITAPKPMQAMKIKVEILDYKNSYGKDRYLVTPLEGSGKVWVEINLK